MPAQHVNVDAHSYVGQCYVKDYISKHPSGEKRDIFSLPVRAVTDEPVGILGAGVGGLYTALILQSLNVSYEILEASNRTGGRLFTHKFPNGGFYDYFVSFIYFLLLFDINSLL